MPATAHRSPLTTHQPAGFEAVALTRIVSVSAAVLMVGMAVLFAARRIAGGLVEPLSPLLLLSVGVALIAVASLLRLPWLPGSTGRRLNAAGYVGLLLPLPVLLLFGLALTLPGEAPWSLVVFWIALTAHEAAWGVGLGRSQVRPHGRNAPQQPAPPGRGGERAQSSPPPAARRMTAAASAEVPAAVAEPPAESARPAANVTQRLVRTRESDGRETVTGTLRAHFAAGERTQSLHIAFCPPLDDAPSLECEQTDGPPAKITLGEVQSYGARIDLRLSRPTDVPATVTVEFFAHGSLR